MNYKKLYKKVQDKRNVVGCSMELMPRIQNGRERKSFFQDVFRVYVKRKEPLHILKRKDIVPSSIKGFRTDVVEIGEINIFQDEVYLYGMSGGSATTDRTSKLRPVPLAASVGHITITAGSLGMAYTKDESTYWGSNAHVLTPDAGMAPDDITILSICQPGTHHDSGKYVNGNYVWHDRVKSMTDNECPVSKAVVIALNYISKRLGRTSRFSASSTNVINHQDFGVYEPTTKHTLKVPDASIEGKKFIGHLFAGGETLGVICKVKYAIEAGYTPVVEHTPTILNDKVWGASFWGDYETTVSDPSAAIQVNYGNFTAMFEDVILVKNNNVIRGGWSGSGWYKV